MSKPRPLNVTNFARLEIGQRLTFTGSEVVPVGFTNCTIPDTLTALGQDRSDLGCESLRIAFDFGTPCQQLPGSRFLEPVLAPGLQHLG